MHLFLVVDGDASLRRKTRLGLEIDGAFVLEADSIRQARDRAYSQGLVLEGIDGIVIDPDLPDGDGLDLVPEFKSQWPNARVVVLAAERRAEGGHEGQPEGRDAVARHSDGRREGRAAIPKSMTVVPKGDLPSLIDALAQTPTRDERDEHALAVVEILRNEYVELQRDWEELCRWDPMLPPDCVPPHAPSFLASLVNAMARPQPLGWGADPDVEKAADMYVAGISSIDVGIGQLVCLREAFRRRILGRVPEHEMAETMGRLQMVIDRAMGVAATRMTERLQEQAHVDVLTGLLNRRALARDLRREVGRAARYHRAFSLMTVDVDGLKRVNDSEGHAAGDALLQRMADAMRAALRTGDSAYRVGGDEFVLMLIETDGSRADIVANRIKSSGSPSFSWGAVSFPDDGHDLDELLDLADQRLYEQRRRVRGTTERLT